MVYNGQPLLYRNSREYSSPKLHLKQTLHIVDDISWLALGSDPSIQISLAEPALYCQNPVTAESLKRSTE